MDNTPVPEKITYSVSFDATNKSPRFRGFDTSRGEEMRALRVLNYSDADCIARIAKERGITPENYILGAAVAAAEKDIRMLYMHERKGLTKGVLGSRDPDIQNAYLDLLRAGKEPTPALLGKACGTGVPTTQRWMQERMRAWADANAEIIRDAREEGAATKRAKEGEAEAPDASIKPEVVRGYTPRAKLALAQSSDNPKILDVLAGEPDRVIAKFVAWNKCTSAKTLRYLSTHDDPYVRRAVKIHPNTPDNIKEKLSDDPDEKVRFFIPDGQGKGVYTQPPTPALPQAEANIAPTSEPLPPKVSQQSPSTPKRGGRW